MIVCLIDWLKVSEICNFWSWMRGNEMTFPNFLLAFYLNEFKFISTQNPRVKMTWLLPFEIQRVFEKIWIPFGNISNSKKLYATQWFSWEKIKWLLQLYEIWVGSQKESNWKSFESILKLPFKFGIIWILFKLFFS